MSDQQAASATVAVVTLTTTLLSTVQTQSSPTASLIATVTQQAGSATKTLTSFVVQTATATIIVLNDGTAQGQSEGGLSHPSEDQIKMVWVAGVMLAALLLGWNMIILRDILYPWKMWANVIHEGCHVLVGTLTGAKVYSVTVDPDKGPISGMTGGLPMAILLSGYLGSILVGSALVFASFDISASKIAALIVYPALVLCFWFGRTWARIRVLVCIGVSIGFFFIDHAYPLRFYILFLFILNAFYVVWDVVDDQIFRKTNESDAALMARLSAPTMQLWILLWLVVTLAFVALAIVGGLHFFATSVDTQVSAQKHFLPT